MPDKTFDAYMAEGGKQSTLDSLRKNFQYDSAKAQYEKTGSYGDSISTVSPAGAGSRTDYATQLADTYSKTAADKQSSIDKSRQSLIDYYTGLPSMTDRFTNLREQNGLPQQEELVNSLTKNVMSTEDMLDAVKPSVNQRAGDFLVDNADRNAMIARESEPLLDSLTKLLRSKQYEEIGLSNKQALVSELLSLSLEDDKMRAKPYELGVDFSEADYTTALDLLKTTSNFKYQAYNDDTSSAEAKAAEERAATRATEASDLAYKRDKEMKNLDFELSKKLKSYGNSIGSSKASQKAATEDVFNTALSKASTEYDVWKYIDDNREGLSAAGIDMDELWKMHNSLAAKVGTGGSIRASSESSYGEYL